ncbi:MAG: sigma-54 dependent transcriptional regulator [Duncaniella sp.]|nr:sigma-54 dependent transcriptional regulator [Duncaniella sp.]
MILIVDDDKSVRLSLRLLLRRNGYDTLEASGPEEAMAAVRSGAPLSLVLLDMNYSRSTTGEEGLTLLRQIKLFIPDVPVILITAWGSIPLAVEAMRAGAVDFVTKPWDNGSLLAHVESAISLASKRESDADDASDPSFDRSAIIGRDPALLNLLDTVRRVAPTEAPVLITGENGTGKELIADAIHRNSLRRGGPLVKVNLGGIATSLFESEMFGHKKGAFTGAVADRKGRFETAQGGTIFLDEIGDLDLNSQVKLLRVLQEHTFEPLGDSRTLRADIRVVCATNADLPAMVADRTFREDLFYRINLVTLRLPALRERRDDIPLLVDHLIRTSSLRTSDGATQLPSQLITPEALDYLRSLQWPGNVRQLRNAVERALITSDPSAPLPLEAFTVQDLGTPDLSPEGRLAMTERQAIMAALAESGGNLTRAASLLGITRQGLYRRLEKFDIPR